jgi:predicted transcriptional regulator
MTIKLRQEIEVWYIIPAIRREMAKGLVKKGLKQREVARRLGVTDAAVSQYFTSKRGKEVRFSKRISKEIMNSVDGILRGANVMREIQKLCRICHDDGICCYIHKHHGAPSDCRVCHPDKVSK